MLITEIAIWAVLLHYLTGVYGTYSFREDYMKFCNPPEDLTEVFPYVISVVADIDDGESCTVYGEEHICGDKSIGITISHEKELIVYKVYTLLGKGPRVANYIRIRNLKPVVTDSFSIKIYYNTIMFYDEFLLSEKTSFKLRNDFWRLFGKCKNSKSVRRMTNGSCKRRPCQVRTCHNHFVLRPLGFDCVKKRLDPCMDGYCHDGECKKNLFQQFCDCPRRGFLGIQSPYLGEYCSIRRKEDLDRNMKLLKSTEVDVEIQDNLNLKVEVSTNLEYHYFRCVFVALYKIPQFQEKFNKELCKGTKYSKSYYFHSKVETNQTYAIEVTLHQGKKERVVFNFLEIETPGYSVLEPPSSLKMETLPGNVFMLSWQPRGSIPPKEYGVQIARKDSSNVDFTPTNHIRLLLQSETWYSFTVTAVNKIGVESKPSSPLRFTTPRFTENTSLKGRYNFSRWVFKNNTILLRGDKISFKSLIRRDVRVVQLVIIIHPSETRRTHMEVFNAVRFNRTYAQGNGTKPYVAALFKSKSLPAELRIGDKVYYGGYLNGYLLPNTTYQVYTVLWYRPLKTIDITVRRLGEYKGSPLPWIKALVAVVVAVFFVLITSLVMCHLIQCCSRKRKKPALEAESVVDEVYLNDLLEYPQVDITKKQQKPHLKSTFSFVKELRFRTRRRKSESDSNLSDSEGDCYENPNKIAQMS